jgi:large subunit ribosomal protein L21
MYAIVDIAGQQFKVEEGRRVFVNRLEAEEGSTISFEKILLKDTDGNVVIGTPYLEGATVSATVLKHLKGKKVLVFKKKRRKGYQKCNGHRQYLTQIRIDTIS